MAQLAAVTLEINRWRAKFKLGQNRPVEARRQVIAELRKRGRPNDGRAADALQWTIDARAEPECALQAVAGLGPRRPRRAYQSHPEDDPVKSTGNAIQLN